jgi:hypothetical protein
MSLTSITVQLQAEKSMYMGDSGQILVLACQLPAEQSEILAKKAVYHQMQVTYLQLQAAR